MTNSQTDLLNPRTRRLIVVMFAVLVGLSFFARHVAGRALEGTSYNALVFNVQELTSKNPASFIRQPNNLVWDETFAYARYTQQVERGDWFGNTFQSYADYAQAGSERATPHYPFFFDRGGVFLLGLLMKLTGDVSGAFALADLIFPLLLALCAVLFCLQLRPSLSFALLASACFIWFNWSDSATWLAALRDSSVGDGMVFSRTPYPQLAIVTFLLFALVLLRVQRAPGLGWTILLAFVIALNAVTYVYSWILALAIVAVPPVLFVIKGPLALRVERNFVFACLGALGVSLILSAPVWGAYLLAPDIAHDLVTRFADEQVNTPDAFLRTAVLIGFTVPLVLPWLKNMKSRVFWLAFWVGAIVAYNQQLVTTMDVQISHYPPYYFGTFAMIYLIDLALAIWERVAPRLYSVVSSRALPVLAGMIVIGGFVAITWRMVSLARVQADYNRTDASLVELVSTLNHTNGDYVILTTDNYLNLLLPAYVKQRFVLPVFTDPMTNAEIAQMQDAAAHLLGYTDWHTWLTSTHGPAPNTQPVRGKWELDPNRVIFVVNRQRENRNPTNFAKTLLVSQDYLVGIAPQ